MNDNPNTEWWTGAGVGATVSTIVLQYHPALWVLLIGWLAWVVAEHCGNRQP